MAAISKSLTITNPLTIYRTLVASNRIEKDPSQHRLALHLEKLYERLKDYEPKAKYSERLTRLTQALHEEHIYSGHKEGRHGTVGANWPPVLRRKERNDSLALTQVPSNYDAALKIDSPRGLLLHGEVGSGKSMLVDLFADCLPSDKKQRWHFHNFILNVLANLEDIRRTRAGPLERNPVQSFDAEHPILSIAKDMISTTPILFLDEFQLPDRATSKILSHLMTSFFHLGGVLIATSNRMPEDLAKAAGVELAPPPSRLESLDWRLGLLDKRWGKGEINPAVHGDFSAFLELLKARCDVWEMHSSKDYRRSESHSASHALTNEPGSKGLNLPDKYLVKPLSTALDSVVSGWSKSLQTAIEAATGIPAQCDGVIPWEASSMRVYGRIVSIPRYSSKVSCWTFKELCEGTFGPADYLALASACHTIILLDVPILEYAHRNEARRFITLIDALYEARCKLLISAAAGPDDIFFPDQQVSKAVEGRSGTSTDDMHSETFSELYQDATAPFRPNVSRYASSMPEGIIAEDALEDDPPNRARGREVEVKLPVPMRKGPDFTTSGMFIGEDEHFAYKRARSRLWEMCGAQWWQRQGEGWWTPIPKHMRPWEKSVNDAVVSGNTTTDAEPLKIAQAKSEGSELASPFRVVSEPPPTIDWTHIWGAIKWGKRAGAWGQGPEGLRKRKKSPDEGEPQVVIYRKAQ